MKNIFEIQPAKKETIFAVASGWGRCAISVIRISGAECENICAKMIRGPMPVARRVTVRTVWDPITCEPLDKSVVLRLKAPKTYTGEDMLELQVTGGPAVVRGMLRALSSFPGVRVAEPGEFAKRAFESGKLDLSAIEGLVDLVEAETDAQRRRALKVANGSICEQAESVRQDIVEAMGIVASELDFSDLGEEDEYNYRQRLSTCVFRAREKIEWALENSVASERLKDGIVVAIMGPPNAGKSTLLNAIVRRDVVIVSPIEGTTRDAVEVGVYIGGFSVTLVDTAGIRKSEDPLETEGVARALKHGAGADVVLWLSERCEFPTSEICLGERTIYIQSKCDLERPRVEETRSGVNWWRVSTVSKEGVNEILEELQKVACVKLAGPAEAILTRERHKKAFREAGEALAHASELGMWEGAEVVAESLRLAASAMERVTGRIGVEEVLTEVFSQLCVGK